MSQTQTQTEIKPELQDLIIKMYNLYIIVSRKQEKLEGVIVALDKYTAAKKETTWFMIGGGIATAEAIVDDDKLDDALKYMLYKLNENAEDINILGNIKLFATTKKIEGNDYTSKFLATAQGLGLQYIENETKVGIYSAYLMIDAIDYKGITIYVYLKWAYEVEE